MKKLSLVLVALFALSLPGCSTVIGKEAAKAHKTVFGCWPQGYEAPRELEAQGPKDEVKKDFLGYECGKPVYKKPSWSTCTGPDCVVPGK